MVKAIVKLQLLDIVAIKEDLPDCNLLAGQVGTIVEFLVPEVYEVEIILRNSEEARFLTLHGSIAQLQLNQASHNGSINSNPTEVMAILLANKSRSSS
jgi:uncharacterized membrane protein